MSTTDKPTIKELRARTRFIRAIASFISYVFHPVLMPTVMTLALYKLAAVGFAGVKPKVFGNWLFIIILNTLIFPLVGVLLMKGLGFIRSMHMRDAKERIIPLLMTMTFYFWAYHVFQNIDSPFILRVLLLGSFWSVIALFMVNIFMKVSMHTAAAGGMLGLVIVLMLISPINMAIPLFIALVIAGLVGTARMLLGAHNGAEIWMGYLLGIIVQIAAYFYIV